MPYQPSVSSNITRNTTSAEGISLDFPIFCASHTYFKERVRNYSSWDGFREDESIPSGSDMYNAVKTAFTQNPAPSRVYVGRRAVDTTIITPDSIELGKVYGFQALSYNNTTGDIANVVVSFEATDTLPATVLGSWLTQTNALTGATAVISGGTLEVVADTGYSIVIKSFVKSSATYVSTENATDLLTAIQAEDNDWYCMVADDHTEAFQLEMASAIEATNGDYPKIYWTSTSSAGTVVAIADPATDIGAKLKGLNYNRTILDNSHVSEYVFPEIGSFSYNSVYQAGSTTYKFMRVAGVPAAADTTTGNRLTEEQQGYLEDRNMGYMAVERGQNFYHGGKTVGGEWTDIVIGSDWLNDQIEVAVLNLFLNNKGSKVSYAKPAAIKSTIDQVLQRAVNIGFLDGYKGAEIPDYLTEVPFSEKVSRILDNVKWTGYIAGAVHFAIINGNLTYQSSELS